MRPLPASVTDSLGLRVPRVMDFDALGQQALAPALTPPREDGASALGFHARAETELVFPRPLGWLVGAFHKKSIGGGFVLLSKAQKFKTLAAQKRGATLSARRRVSTMGAQMAAADETRIKHG